VKKLLHYLAVLPLVWANALALGWLHQTWYEHIRPVVREFFGPSSW
jgi:hypothetical protein